MRSLLGFAFFHDENFFCFEDVNKNSRLLLYSCPFDQLSTGVFTFSVFFGSTTFVCFKSWSPFYRYQILSGKGHQTYQPNF